ncbi:MAG TPA: nickel-dependent hydrogenase large subunit, partial [Verrucomicrobiae bacterium]|nr:nickel-dependent hydrogenase large subunit [Verrucomicrobiae bacterium]
DVCAIAAMYPEWLNYGAGIRNYLAVPDLPLDSEGTQFDLPGGTIFDGKLDEVKQITSFNDPYFRDNVAESIAHSWYDGDWTRHPWRETTVPKYDKFDDSGKYSWVKAPRFDGHAMQVGPLAQVLVGYATGHELTKKWVGAALSKVSQLSKVNVTPAMLHSTLGRHAARAVRAAMLAELAVKHWKLLVENIAKGDTSIQVKPSFPSGEVRGFGFHEAPRGTLSHWVVIEAGKFANYQAVVPTTWNASPRDEKQHEGPYEAALIGNPVVDAERPLEVLRTIHSFDPCLACAVHAYDAEGRELAKVRVL